MKGSMYLLESNTTVSRRISNPSELNFPLPNVRKAGQGYSSNELATQAQTVPMLSNRQMAHNGTFDEGSSLKHKDLPLH
jgi:hypothetical protein